MKRFALLLLSVFPPLAIGAHGGDAFRVLSWGASEAQIRMAFPMAHQSKCTETWRALARMTGSVCGRPEVVPYEVAGIPFKLRFDLAAANRRLKAVTLFYSGAAAGEESSVKLLVRARFTSLAEGLAARYGDAGLPFVRDESGKLFLSQTWTTPSSTIQLRATYYGGIADNEEYEVSYKPRGGEAAEKL